MRKIRFNFEHLDVYRLIIIVVTNNNIYWLFPWC